MKPPKPHAVPRPCACTAIRSTSRALARAFDAALGPASLGITQLAVLRAIQRNAGEPLSRTAEQLCMDRTSLYRAARRMERQGWLTVTAGADARSKSAEITADGERALANADPHWSRTQSEIIDRFGRQRWQSVVVELRRLREIALEVEAQQPKVNHE